MIDREIDLPLVLIDATASRSGGRVYLESLLGALAEADSRLRFLILHTRDLPLPGSRRFPENFSFELIGFPAIAESHWLIGSLLRFLWRLVRLPGLVRRHEPVVFFSNAGSVPRGLPQGTIPVVAFHNAIPFQPEIHHLEVSRLRRWRLSMLRRQSLGAIRSGAHAIVFSHDLRRRLIEAGAAPEACTVIPHGIEWGEAERSRDGDRPSLPEVTGRYLLYVSQIHRYKNLLSLIEAMAGLKNAHPDLSLVVVGGLHDPDYADSVGRSIARHELERRIHILPAIDRSRLPDLHRRAAAIVYPSLAENCPFALLEAMAMARPIAAADIPAIRELCGEAALYFDPHRPEEIARAIGTILADRPLAERLAESGARRAELFSWRRSGDQTLQLFARLADAGDLAAE